MNKVIHKFLLAGDKFMPEMHLRQPRFLFGACGPFTRHKERIKEMNSIKLVFNTILLMLIIKI